MKFPLLAAFALLLFAASSGAAQLSPESDTTAPTLELRRNGVVAFNVQAWRGQAPDLGTGKFVNIGVNAVGNKPAFLWCNRATLAECGGSGAFNSVIGQISGGTGNAFALPNPAAPLAGASTRIFVQLLGEPDPANGGQRPLLARETREVVFASEAPTPAPTAPPTPEPTPPWRVTSDLLQP